MESLPHRHLTTLTLTVDFDGIVPIGNIPAGYRAIAPVTGGQFEGDRLSGTILPGHDWFVTRSDGTLLIDVRLTLKTNDGSRIYLAYQGRLTGLAEARKQLRSGEVIKPEDYRLTTTASFETGDPRYSWLNDLLVVGVGKQTDSGALYTLFEIGA